MSLPKIWISALLFSMFTITTAAAMADVSFSSGVLTIDASGEDGGDGWNGSSGSDGSFSGDDGDDGRSGQNGRSGEDAGNVTVQISYADQPKTLVRVSGQISGRSRNQPFETIVAVSELRQIQITANGGDGGDGGRGGNGGDGRSGSDGRSGCHATDGEDGGDGGDGGNGGNGGDAGRGGYIQVQIDETQTELFLLVKTTARAGDAGSGGWSGSSGSAGRGGSGGRGGSDGSCNVNGEPTPAPDGRDGRSGSSGSSGSSGYSGSSASSGQAVFLVQTPAGVQTYQSAFRIQLRGLEIQDDNHDGVVEPGEIIHITGISIANISVMPTPKDQALLLSLVDSNIFQVVKMPNLELKGGIAGGETRTWNFEEGEFLLKASTAVPTDGINHPLSFAVRINRLQTYSGSDAGIVVQRPLVLKSAWTAEALTPFFQQDTVLPLDLKNSSAHIIGGLQTREARLVISWVSDQILGEDVQLTLPDGKTHFLSQTVLMPLPEIAPQQNLAVKLGLKITKSLTGSYGKGRLNIRLEMASFDGPSMITMSELLPSIEAAQDLRAVAVAKKVDLKKAKIVCQFTASGDREWTMKTLQIAKAANAPEGQMTLATDSFFGGSKSPAFRVPPHAIARYYDSVFSAAQPNEAAVLEFLNQSATVITQDGGSWKITSCKVGKR